ncbi:MAG: beta-ketoacyl synthase chain length factor [Desulfobacteraceae bacterium]|nr:beta-ketoacyl synthase chain length factor [Desulfobacteraceae bacterium]
MFRADTADLPKYVSNSKLRRVDHYSRMALLAAGRALEDAYACWMGRENTGIIVATGYGALGSTFSFLDSYIEKGDKLAFPVHFSNSVHNAAAAYISICYGITGPSLTVTQFDLSFFSALLTAGTWLETGKVDTVLVGVTDAWCEIMGYCMHGFSLMMDKKSCSFGEGAVFFLISRAFDVEPKYGFFEEISIGQSLYPEEIGQVDLILSPSFTSPASPFAYKEMKKAFKGEFFDRKKGFSPTDTGLDALFAFKQYGKRGTEICCLKYSQDGLHGKMMITPAGVGR